MSLDRDETAQQTFRRMLRDEVAPALRALGMKGSGQHFTLPDPEALLLLAFQRSTDSDAARTSFTVNLASLDRTEYEQQRAEWWGRPTATMELPIGRYTRLGFLMPAGQDHWWTVRAGAPTADLAAEVVAAIERYGLPDLRRRDTARP